jgi:hypothetical protein
MNDLTVGIALGRLSTRGSAYILSGGEWTWVRTSNMTTTEGVTKGLTLEEVFALLQAEEVVV